jgi:hypothetical protein
VRLETIPLILGALVALVGLATLADAIVPDGTLARGERRRRARPPRDRRGQGLLAIGVLLLAASLVGRDAWRWSAVAVIAAFLCMGTGVALNRKYVRGLAFGPVLGRREHRRAADRAVERAAEPGADAPPSPVPPGGGGARESEPRLRIR